MFKLVPFLLILLMISKKANYLNEDDEEILNEISSEFIKTHLHTHKTKNMQKKFSKKGFIVDLRKKVSKEVMDKIQSSQVKYFVYLDEDDEMEMHEMFVN